MFGEFCQAEMPILLLTKKYQSFVTLRKGKESHFHIATLFLITIVILISLNYFISYSKISTVTGRAVIS